MKKQYSYILLFGIIIILITPSIYYIFVGFNSVISKNGSDWATFGSYFGGVTSAMLSFLSIYLIVTSLNTQNKIRLRDEIIRSVNISYEIIENFLQIKIAPKTGDKDILFGLFVWGIVKLDNADTNEIQRALKKLKLLTDNYQVTIEMYEKEFSDFNNLFQNHRLNLTELQKYVKDNLIDQKEKI